MVKRFALRPLEPSEADIHKSFVQYAQHKRWWPTLVHIPNEFPFGSMSESQKWGYLKKRKAMGMKPGVPDLFIAWPTKKFHGLWIEIKKYGKKPRAAQEAFLILMEQKGYATIWSDNINDLIQKADAYFE